jgi:uncharacterized membrane-anchored protein
VSDFNAVTKNSLGWWRFLLPLAVQLAIVVSIPMQKAITLNTGTTVYLQTVPIDPYDVLRGRYVTLNYEISQVATLETLPGWSEDWTGVKRVLYITIEAPDSPTSPTMPWQAVAVNEAYPEMVQKNQRVLKARWQGWGNLDLDLGAYYIPETIGDELEADIREHQELTRAEVKVDGKGQTALVQLWVEDRSY